MRKVFISLFIFSALLTTHYALVTAPAFAATPAPSASATPCPSGELCNPLNTTNFEDLINAISGGLTTIGIPIAVLMIILAGVEFLIAGGSTEMVTRARKTLLYAIIGLAIILIGKGFLSLINDILSLQGGGSPSSSSSPAPLPPTTT